MMRAPEDDAAYQSEQAKKVKFENATGYR